MCRSGPKWKREKVADHKFDFIDTRDFTDNGWFMRSKYLFLYLLVLKDFLVYMADIFTAVTMLTTNTWSSEIFEQCEKKKISNCIPIPFETGKWLFVGCIIFSFLLLGYDSFKAKKIIASRDISYAFTNVMANNYYSLRSYDHFCLFEHVSNSTKLSDDFAFFVFFAFKTWKRLLLANGPRATIQALTLYAIFLAKKNPDRQWYEVDQYLDTKNFSTSALTLTSAFTVLVFSISLLILITAACCYIPLLCHIRGNLKEYCCHKVDKRISELIKRKQKQRLVEAAKLAHKEAKGDFSHLKNKKGQMVAQPLPQPTLPNLSVDDDDDISTIPKSKAAAGSTYTYNPNEQYYYDSKNDYPPPMPPYNPYSQHQAPGAPQYQSSQASLYEENSGYYNNGNTAGYDINDNESTAHLTAGSNQQPYGGYSQSPIERPGTTGPYNRHDGYSIERPGTTGPHNNMYDPHDVYQGRTGSATESRRHSPPQSTGTPQPYEYSNHSQSQTLYETSPNTYNSGGYSHQQYSSQQQPGRYGGGGGYAV